MREFDITLVHFFVNDQPGFYNSRSLRPMEHLFDKKDNIFFSEIIL